MKKVAQFEKVSFEEFAASFVTYIREEPVPILRRMYDDIKLPSRATKGSAGYDFYSVDAFNVKSGQTILIPTGIKVKIDEGWMLTIVPRSGLGFKYRLQLDNTIGIIDSDYYNNENNEGHIFIKITCDAKSDVNFLIKKGMAFAQGLFIEYGITYDDETVNTRNGGLGSTDSKVEGENHDH